MTLAFRQVDPCTATRTASAISATAIVLLCAIGVSVAMEPTDKPAKNPQPAENRSPKEVIGPIAPSIHVPPVRTMAPARTQTISRPPQYDEKVTRAKRKLPYKMESLRLAIEDLIATYGDQYPGGLEYLERWQSVHDAVEKGDSDAGARFSELREDAMLAHPLLRERSLLVVKRKKGQLGLPTNHQCNTALEQDGYDNELAILSSARPASRLRTLFRPAEGRYVGEPDLHWDGDRLLFTMPTGKTWQIHEIGLDGNGLRQVSRETPDVDNFDACYLPDGRIAFLSTASFTGVPCWHGRERACCVYAMDAEGTRVRQLGFDQDLDLHPAVLSNGQLIFSRWEYTGLLHAYVRPLIAMNPDGTGQRAVYGSNAYYPNCLFFPQPVPGDPSKIVAVLAGYHGQNRMGELAVLDLALGGNGPEGILHRITHRGEPIVPVALDRLTVKAPHQFLHPRPLTDKYILTAMRSHPRKRWGIYLVDVFDNVTPILTDPEFDFFDPILIEPRPKPPVIPDRTDPAEETATVVLHDIYEGPGLEGVPRGTIRQLRIAAYHFGFPGMAGPDKIGRGGPWEVMRILGTVPVYEDGSAKFRIPASTPITIQALDGDGKAVQVMRSWYTAMPGETASCVGCHERPRETPEVRGDLATRQPVSEVEPWYGPARGFDFAREVQPVLDEHCVRCHNGEPGEDGTELVDLRDETNAVHYVGLPLTKLGATRIDPSIPKALPELFSTCAGMPFPYGELRTHYTPAYEALIPFIRRVNVEDGVSLLNPGEYHADTSELIQMLAKGHHGVRLDKEAWDRLVTWIDLNGPCHGTWGEVAEIPNRVDRRRYELAQQFGGPKTDCEIVPAIQRRAPARALNRPAQVTKPDARRKIVARLLAGLDSPGDQPRPATRMVRFGDRFALPLVHLPAGSFVMGDTTGEGDEDEWPASMVSIENDFWIGSLEITNEQLRYFLPEHSSGFFTKRQIEFDGPGVQEDEPRQPAVRVSWHDAMRFCARLSEETGLHVALPTEAQWEYAARAGTVSSFSFGETGTDFHSWANVADRSLACLYVGTAGVANLQPFPSDMRFDDLAIATAPVASYQPNRWGLFDMHGNAAEWTRSRYRPYPYDRADGRNAIPGPSDGEDPSDTERRVVRGGSFQDRPMRCRSSFRLAYPAWQRVHNVGFRVVIEEGP